MLGYIDRIPKYAPNIIGFLLFMQEPFMHDTIAFNNKDLQEQNVADFVLAFGPVPTIQGSTPQPSIYTRHSPL